jgi:hypothetical protein
MLGKYSEYLPKVIEKWKQIVGLLQKKRNFVANKTTST